ncbi:MAG: hypothetical protein ACRC11_05140 [Xenococcaceae cyanobacterium]
MSGINLTLYLGRERPQTAPREIIEALESVEVTLSDDARSGFQMVFQIGRSGEKDLEDYKLLNILNNPNYFAPFNRVVLVVTINGNARVLMDGAITYQQFTPSQDLGRSTFTVTGEDISVLMDREERSLEHIQQDEETIVRKIIADAKYAKYNIHLEIGKDTRSQFRDVPNRSDRTPTQQGTDLGHIQDLARRLGYVFYITPGLQLFQNTAYWGPPIRAKIAQPTITVNMAGWTNAHSINFQFNSQNPSQVKGQVQDRVTNKIFPVDSSKSSREPLAKKSGLELLFEKKVQQVKQFRETGRDSVRSGIHAQAQVNHSNDDTVTVSGELDTVRYSNLLELRGVVDLRGVGYTYDGTYYVKKVTHQIRKGEYKQNFTLTREGLGSRRSVR